LTYYHDRDESVYFGLGQAIPKMWETETVFMVEGAFDVFPVQRVFENTFAALTLGTSEALARLVRRFVRQVWLVYDNDRDGRQACLDFQKDYGDTLDVRILTPPRVRLAENKYTKDPNELWEVWGDDRFRDYLLRQVDPYMIERKNHA
jgi:DNA primase